MDGPQADSLDEDFGRYMAVLQSLPGYTEASREDRECGERKQLVPVAIAGVAMTIALWALVFIGTGGFWKPPRS